MIYRGGFKILWQFFKFRQARCVASPDNVATWLYFLTERILGDGVEELEGYVHLLMPREGLEMIHGGRFIRAVHESWRLQRPP